MQNSTDINHIANHGMPLPVSPDNKLPKQSSWHEDAFSSNKYYFTCPSYGFITSILSVIDRIVTHDPEITIFVLDEQMRRFWQLLITANNLDWKITTLNTKIPGRFRNIRSWLKIRHIENRLFEDHFRAISQSYFYCCGSANDLILFSLIDRIAKNNRVVFLDLVSVAFPALYNLKSAVVLIHTWFFYRLDVRILNVAGQPSIFLSDAFFKKRKIQHKRINYLYDPDLLRKYNPLSPSLTSGKIILWLDDDSLTYTKKLRGDILVFLRALKRIVDQHFAKDEVLYKRHPNPGFQSRDFTAIYDDYDEYPSYVSADFILSNSNIRYVVGGLSAVLSAAAKNSGIRVVSYAKFVPYEDQAYKRRVIDLRMRESDQKISFPDSMEELFSLFDANPKQGHS